MCVGRNIERVVFTRNYFEPRRGWEGSSLAEPSGGTLTRPRHVVEAPYTVHVVRCAAPKSTAETFADPHAIQQSSMRGCHLATTPIKRYNNRGGWRVPRTPKRYNYLLGVGVPVSLDVRPLPGSELRSPIYVYMYFAVGEFT